MKKLIQCLNDYIMDDFKEHMIVNVVLHLITLFTKNEDTAKILFGNSKILEYIFKKLSSPTGKPLDDFEVKNGVSQSHQVRETIRLATLALSRLSSKFDRQKINDENFINQLKKFDNFSCMLQYISGSLKNHNKSSNQNENNKQEEDKPILA